MVRLPKGLAPIHSTAAMFRGVLRAALSVGLMLALWTVSRPAAAAVPAGLCDDRGASAIAPPPSLEAPDEAIQRARAPLPCGGELESRVAVSPGHRGAGIAQNDGPSALRWVPIVWVEQGGTVIPFAEPAERRGLGVHFRVERPPRG